MNIKTVLLQNLVAALVSTLDKDTMRSGVDSLLDVVEDAIEDSRTTIDDAVLLPLINSIREAFNIPDNDEEIEQPAVQ